MNTEGRIKERRERVQDPERVGSTKLGKGPKARKLGMIAEIEKGRSDLRAGVAKRTQGTVLCVVSA